MRFGSVCSGIEAASVAWNPLGWEAAWLAEIEPFPSAVLAHHYPEVPNLGDMTTIAKRVLTGEVEAPDVFCGGTPCQAFSVAGLRQSLDDARGNLSLKFVELADAIDHVRVRAGKPASIVFWENVPGVLSTKDNAFGCFLAGLAGEDEPLQPPGEKWANAGCVYGPARAIAWRTLDAQYTGVAQRRRRVFVVASARNGFDPAQVLFEWDGSRRDTAPSREKRQVATTIPARSLGGGGLGTDFDCDGGLIPSISQCITTGTGQRYDPETETILPVTAHTLRGEGFDASEDGSGHGTPLVPVCHVDTMPTMTAGGPSASSHHQTSGQMRDQYIVPVLPFDTTQITSKANRSNPAPGDPCHPLAAGAHALAIAFPANLSGTQYASTEDLSPALGALNPTAVAVALRGREGGATAELGDEVQNCLRASGGGGDKAHVLAPVAVAYSPEIAATMVARSSRGGGQTNSPPPVLMTAMQVRRLTPVECARLQGFPDDYLDITVRGKPAADGPKYKALGNSWAVPCARWIGRRIDAAIKA